MNSIDFCFWLQGHFEISEAEELTPKQVEIIKNHLHLVFRHEIDPLREEETTTPTAVLNDAHSPAHQHNNDSLVRC